MAAPRTRPSHVHQDHSFIKELPGENPPSFSALQKLYESSTQLWQLRPWELINDSRPIVVRDTASGELCYCSVMGALGEVYSVHAYIGSESFRLFQKILAEQIIDPGEFFATQRGVSVEFVPRSELERQDRELLAQLGHPPGKKMASPIFRALRPGFHPWFVTAEEAQTLNECIHGTIAVCSAVAQGRGKNLWRRANVYPLVTHGNDGESRIEPIECILPNQPPVVPARLDQQTLSKLRSQDYPIRGAIELDQILSGAPIGKRNERKAITRVALVVDGQSGLVLGVNVTEPGSSDGDSLARALFNAVQAGRTLPKEVSVRTQQLAHCLAPLLESFGIRIQAAKRLPAADAARSHLLQFLGGGL